MSTTERCLEWAVVAGCLALSLLVACGVGFAMERIDRAVRRRKGRR